MSEENELEEVSREAAATVLRRLADGVVGGSVRIGEERIDLPDRLDVEVEYEGEAEEREIEVELEWSEPAGSAASALDEASADTDEASESEPTEDEETGETEDVGATEIPAQVTEIVGPGERVESGSGSRFEVYEDRAGEWRWRLVHANGNVIADSGEGYSRKANARKGLRSVQANAQGAEVVEE